MHPILALNYSEPPPPILSKFNGEEAEWGASFLNCPARISKHVNSPAPILLDRQVHPVLARVAAVTPDPWWQGMVWWLPVQAGRGLPLPSPAASRTL